MEWFFKKIVARVESLCVETRIALLDEKHLRQDSQIFLGTFLECEIGFEEACIPMGCRKVFTDRKVLWQIQHEKHLILFSLRLVVSKAENLCLSFCCLVLFSYSL